MIEGERGINYRLELSGGSPFEGGVQVLAIATVTTDEALLLYEEWPEVETDVAPGGRSSGHDRAATREAFETFWQHVTTDVFDDQIHAMLVRELADFGWPVGFGGVHREVRTKFSSEFTFGIR